MRTQTTITKKGRNDHKDRSRSCPNIVQLSCGLVIGWVTFIFYCVKFHLFDQQKLSVIINDFDRVLNQTEEKIKSEFKSIHLRAPISHFPGGDEMNFVDYHQKKTASVNNDGDVHVVFSTDCSFFQDWQSLLVFHSATLVHQKGKITRIASGCDEEKKKELTQLYAILFPQYNVHFTPDFKKDNRTNKNYHFYNKPRGLKHWLEHSTEPIPDGTVIALIDPDFIFLRPLTTQINGLPGILYDKFQIKPEELFPRIMKGQPVSQRYGLGAPWTNDIHKHFKRGKICGEGSPCLQPNDRYGNKHFSVGPPYILEVSDFRRLSNTWNIFVERVYEGYPYLLAEMYAYSMAAAHENLPHLTLENYMVSNIDAGGEGWSLVDALNNNTCQPLENGRFYSNLDLPIFLHYCQGYRLETIGFYKRQIPNDLFSCKHSLFVDPHKVVRGLPSWPSYQWNPYKRNKVDRALLRNSFAVCVMYDTFNSMLMEYKKKICEPHLPREMINYEMTYSL